MRKPVAVGLVIAAVLIAGAGTWSYSMYRSTSADFEALKVEDEAMRKQYAGAIDEIAAIQDSLNAIVLGPEQARLVSDDIEARITETGGDRALARIAVVKAGIERAKDRIQELESNLKKSGVKVGGLQQMIAQLKENVSRKEEQIAGLTVQVDTLQTRVAVQDMSLEAQRRELGTVYYLIGSKKELAESGAVVASGGLLGIGKTLEPSGHVSEGLLTALDTDFETTLRIPSPKVEILSAQPVASYELQVVGNETHLRILQPAEFRTVKQLLIMTG